MLTHALGSALRRLLVLFGGVWCWGHGWVTMGPVCGRESYYCRFKNAADKCQVQNCTMLGLLTTVVLFLRLRRTSLWNTWELSLQMTDGDLFVFSHDPKASTWAHLERNQRGTSSH